MFCGSTLRKHGGKARDGLAYDPGHPRGRAAMTTVICICRVADYDAFRPGYDEARELFSASIRSWRLGRGQDDPNMVLIEETFDSRETAEAIWNSPETAAAMEADGIDMASLRVEYMDEMDNG